MSRTAGREGGFHGLRQGGSLFGQLVQQLAEGIAASQGKRVNPLYQTDPLAWAVDTLHIREETIRWSMDPAYQACHCLECQGAGNAGQPHLWDGTADPFLTVLDSLARNRDVGVESATGTGKTFIGGALVVPWWLCVFEGSLVVTTAPKEQQLMLHLWKELGRQWEKFQVVAPQAQLNKLQLRMKPPGDDWTAVGFACGVGAAEQSATKAQGFHAEHMLIITEETPGINLAVMTAFENTCTGSHNRRLAFGNPDHEEDALHKFCIKPTTVHVRISALDHPNVVTGREVVPGAVARQNVLDRAANYGEDSRIYKSRVRGICPSESTDALIRLAWCAGAAELSASREDRERLRRLGPGAKGVDVANSDRGDKAAIATGQGACLDEVVSFACPDANRLGARVALEMSAQGIVERFVGVDKIGVGAGCVNELKRLGYHVQALGGADGARSHAGEEKFGNLRAQMWWKMREDLRHGRVALPEDKALFKDLTAPLYFTRNGLIYIESKDDIRKRLGRSPDLGDACVYWNWVRERTGGGTRGGRLVVL